MACMHEEVHVLVYGLQNVWYKLFSFLDTFVVKLHVCPNQPSCQSCMWQLQNCLRDFMKFDIGSSY
jgi:hypothetical protein